MWAVRGGTKLKRYTLLENDTRSVFETVPSGIVGFKGTVDGTIINYPPAPLHGQGLMRVGVEPRSAGQGGSASSSSTSSSNMPNGVSPGVFVISDHASMPQFVA